MQLRIQRYRESNENRTFAVLDPKSKTPASTFSSYVFRTWMVRHVLMFEQHGEIQVFRPDSK